MNQGPCVAGAYPHQIFRREVFMEKMRNKKLGVQELRNRLQKELPRLRQEYAVRSLGLFGSYVRGEHRKGSDLDVLVEFFQVPGMLRFLDLERDLAAILGVSVDLVQKEALKPSIGKRILEEVLPV
jgi:predicted nucleotidyltransferase